MQETQYDFYYDQNFYQDVCIPVSDNTGSFMDRVVSLPADIGIGYYRHIAPCKHMEVHICDVTFYKKTILRERAYRDAFSIIFCFSDRIEWNSVDGKEHFDLGKGECCIYTNGFFEVDHIYEPGKRYMSVTLSLYPSRFRMVTEQLLRNQAALLPDNDRLAFRRFKVTKTAENVLNQLLRCNFSDDLKAMYLEGKILELASSLTHDITHEQEAESSERDLSVSDLASLMRVRRYIDDNLSSELTISELAKQCFMSQSKLRSVFREQYGITIHQYILNRRMETARKMFVEHNGRVKEVASCVGYSNISHFSDTFKRKYGCTPSEYKKNCD